MKTLSLATPLVLATLATAQSAYLVDSNLDQLFLVDVTTGAATFIASTNNNGLGTPADLSYRAATGELWTIDLSGGEVGTIDTTTGVFTPVHLTGLNGWQGMAWDEVTQMFYLANQNGNNYVLDPATGITTLMNNSGYSLITCLDTDASGNLFGIDFNTGFVVQVDKTTGIGTTIASGPTLNGFQGLGIELGTGTWYAANTNTDALHIVDPVTGAQTQVGPHGSGVVFAKGFDMIDQGGSFATKRLYGDGCYSTFASFYESGPFDLSNTSLGFTNTGTGYVVLGGTNGVAPPTVTPIPMGDDVVVPFSLGWTFPYPGGTTQTLWVSSNGFVHGVSNTSSGCCSFSSTMFLSAGPVWSALWDDLNPSAGGQVYMESDPVAGTALVTFDQVPEFGTSNFNTFQYYFDANGAVELRYGACAVSAAGVGWSPGQSNLDPGSMDISATPVIITQANDVLPLRLDASARPVIGTTLNMNVTNVPAGTLLGAVIYGLVKHDPGINLVGIGMPDCFQYCSQDAVQLVVNPPGTSFTVPFSVPNNAAFAGLHILGQGAAYDPAGGHNALGAISTNGVDFGLDVN